MTFARMAAEGPLPKESKVMFEQEGIYPTATKEFGEQRKALAPKTAEAFKAFSQSVFAEGALSAKNQAANRCGSCARNSMSAIASEGIQTPPCKKEPLPRKSWRPSGLLPKCGLGEPTPIQYSRLIRLPMFRTKRADTPKRGVQHLMENFLNRVRSISHRTF